jgi:hypothetical protein
MTADKPTILDAPPGLDVWQAAAWTEAKDKGFAWTAHKVAVRASLAASFGPFEPAAETEAEPYAPLRSLAAYWREQARLLTDLAAEFTTSADGLDAEIDRQAPTKGDRHEG